LRERRFVILLFLRIEQADFGGADRAEPLTVPEATEYCLAAASTLPTISSPTSSRSASVRP
jgi:hypothetical protein